MNSLRNDHRQRDVPTAESTRLAIAAVTVFLTCAQVPTSRGADSSPAGAAAAPKVALPANTPAAAQPMPAALEKLITDFRKARTACSTDGVPAGFVSHVTKRGETAKTIIRQYWADLPLKEDFLKALIVRLNPEAPVKSLISPLKTGTLLAIPSITMMNDVMFPSAEKSAGKSAEDEREPVTHIDGNFAAGWVRFP
jgi:Tfp pilus assembly protein FimV